MTWLYPVGDIAQAVADAAISEAIEFHGEYGECDDITPLVTAVAKLGLPKATSLCIHPEVDGAEYPLGDLRPLRAGLPSLETLDARGVLERIAGMPTLRECRLWVTPLNDAALADLESESWPMLESLIIEVDASPYPEGFSVSGDASRLHELEWPQWRLPRLRAQQLPQLQTLELCASHDAYVVLQHLLTEAELLARLDALKITAGYISRRTAQLMLDHAEQLTGIEELDIDPHVGWAVDREFADTVEQALPNVMVSPNIGYG
ncbi:MAG: hypothetical protein AAF799_17330 [Myxococcota bacterium]